MPAKHKTNVSIAIVWKVPPGKGRVEVANGILTGLRAGTKRCPAEKGTFTLPGSGSARLAIEIGEARLAAGARATLVQIVSRAASFSFFLRDVDARRPIWIPDHGVAITTDDDRRNYEQIASAIRALGLVSSAQQYESEKEETYEAACARNLKLECPTWLGLSRDMRIFHLGRSPVEGYFGYVEPAYHGMLQTPGDVNIAAGNQAGNIVALQFCLGPGNSCRVRISRRLEEGVLPILHARQVEDDVTYHLTAFVTLETRPISAAALRGSDWRAVYPHGHGHMLGADEMARLKPLIESETRGREEETVCCVRVEAVNSGRVPRYAWLKGLYVRKGGGDYNGWTGFRFAGGEAGKVCGINLLDGKPMPQGEMAVLLPPGGKVVLDMLVPHQALPPARARKLARLNVARHLDACRAFWKAKLAQAAEIRVPEPAIDERIRAGLLHCDLVAFGQEPRGNVLASIGVYCPIGSESSPIIQFFDSMGWHKLAERSLNFFLARQRGDGFIQNFGGYQLETGPALWSMGEHFRYTRDTRWVRRVKPNILRACDYLLKWRERNKRPELRGKAYGLLDGKVADPEDFFHSFMLNGVSYVGLQRAAEMLAGVDPRESRRLAREAAAFHEDIREAFHESVGRSPVIPLGDGTWVSSAPPWTESRGPVSLHAEVGNWFTHGAFGARDSLIGALYLILSEVLDPREPDADMLLRSSQELFTVENAGLSQPYYMRHDIAHLRRGEVKAFLKLYYNQFTALQDRQTYTFWEHYHLISQHKTHEEGWFLMQTRWMLWLEEGNGIGFLRGIPRRWLADGKEIRLTNVATYFGPASLSVNSQLSQGRITADVQFKKGRAPKTVSVRLPHPEGLRAARVSGGTYDAASETVTVRPFKGTAHIALEFG